MFRAAFHTGYVPSGVLRLTKHQLDGACADDRFSQASDPAFPIALPATATLQDAPPLPPLPVFESLPSCGNRVPSCSCTKGGFRLDNEAGAGAGAELGRLALLVVGFAQRARRPAMIGCRIQVYAPRERAASGADTRRSFSSI